MIWVGKDPCSTLHHPGFLQALSSYLNTPRNGAVLWLGCACVCRPAQAGLGITAKSGLPRAASASLWLQQELFLLPVPFPDTQRAQQPREEKGKVSVLFRGEMGKERSALLQTCPMSIPNFLRDPTLSFLLFPLMGGRLLIRTMK